MIEGTYDEIDLLRKNKQLIPGTWYRIIDYETTILGVGAIVDNSSANLSKFDIVILALSTYSFSTAARAIKPDSRNLKNYIGCDLSKWKIEYVFDRNLVDLAINAVDWRCNPKGKGLILRLTDEFNNSAPYDFKSIMFPIRTNYFYTFSHIIDGVKIEATTRAASTGDHSNLYNNTFGQNVRYIKVFCNNFNSMKITPSTDNVEYFSIDDNYVIEEYYVKNTTNNGYVKRMRYYNITTKVWSDTMV